MTVCSYHVTYVFQSESTLYSCLNVKELLAQSRREIWSWSDCNWTRTRTKWFWVRVQLQSLDTLLFFDSKFIEFCHSLFVRNISAACYSCQVGSNITQNIFAAFRFFTNFVSSLKELRQKNLGIVNLNFKFLKVTENRPRKIPI